MKIKELIKELQKFDPEAEIYYSYPYGDYWSTNIVVPIRRVEEVAVEYHNGYDKLVEIEVETGDEQIAIVID